MIEESDEQAPSTTFFAEALLTHRFEKKNTYDQGINIGDKNVLPLCGHGCPPFEELLSMCTPRHLGERALGWGRRPALAP